MRGGRRWAVFVHNVDGDSGDGAIVGPFKTVAGAERKADVIRSMDDSVECIVLPVYPGGASAREVADRVME